MLLTDKSEQGQRTAVIIHVPRGAYVKLDDAKHRVGLG